MKRYITILFILLSIFTVGIYANGSNDNVINFTKSEKEHRTASSSVGISANSLGDISIGFNDDSINVYDKNGNYKYSFDFEVDGAYFFEFDDQDNIMIFTVRGDMCYYFDTSAELVKKFKISDSAESNRYYREHANKKSISILDTKYFLNQAFGYTKLIKTDANGNEPVIYEIGSYYFSKILFVLAILIFVTISLSIVFKTNKDEIKKFINWYLVTKFLVLLTTGKSKR